MRRIGAYIIDVIIGWIAFFVLLIGLGDRVETDPGFCDPDSSPALCFEIEGTAYYAEDDGAAGAIMLLTVGVWAFMGIVVQGTTGGTPGKLMVGLRVVDQRSGAVVGVGKAAARTAMWVVDAIPFIFPLVGLITASASSGHRRIGDMVANTVVVRREAVGFAPEIPGLSESTNTERVPPAPGGIPAPAQTAPGAPGASFPPPPATPSVPPPPPAGAVTGDGLDAPMWDAARSVYRQWDKGQQRWMVYNDTAGAWEPLI